MAGSGRVAALRVAAWCKRLERALHEGSEPLPGCLAELDRCYVTGTPTLTDTCCSADLVCQGCRRCLLRCAWKRRSSWCSSQRDNHRCHSALHQSIEPVVILCRLTGWLTGWA